MTLLTGHAVGPRSVPSTEQSHQGVGAQARETQRPHHTEAKSDRVQPLPRGETRHGHPGRFLRQRARQPLGGMSLGAEDSVDEPPRLLIETVEITLDLIDYEGEGQPEEVN